MTSSTCWDDLFFFLCFLLTKKCQGESPMAQANLAAEVSANRFSTAGGAGVVLRFGWFYGPGARHSEEFFAPGASPHRHDDGATQELCLLTSCGRRGGCCRGSAGSSSWNL